MFPLSKTFFFSFLTFLLLLTITQAVQAQLYLGVRAGAHLSTLTGIAKLPNTRPDPGYFFGTIGWYQLNESWGIETGLNYSQKGIHILDDLGEYNFRTNNFDIPLLLRLNAASRDLMTGKNLLLTLSGGLYFGYFTNAYLTGGRNSINIYFVENDYQGEGGSDIGIRLGTTLLFQLETQLIGLQLSFDQGISYIKNLPANASKNRVLGLGLIYTGRISNSR